jgi:hypothetical protein
MIGMTDNNEHDMMMGMKDPNEWEIFISNDGIFVLT